MNFRFVSTKSSNTGKKQASQSKIEKTTQVSRRVKRKREEMEGEEDSQATKKNYKRLKLNTSGESYRNIFISEEEEQDKENIQRTMNVPPQTRMKHA